MVAGELDDGEDNSDHVVDLLDSLGDNQCGGGGGLQQQRMESVHLHQENLPRGNSPGLLVWATAEPSVVINLKLCSSGLDAGSGNTEGISTVSSHFQIPN